MKTVNGIDEVLEKVALKMNLTKQEVAEKLIDIDDETVSILNFSMLEKTNDSEDEWTKVSANTLLILKPITHPQWKDAYKYERFREARKDANAGVTFAFYWKDGFLCWER